MLRLQPSESSPHTPGGSVPANVGSRGANQDRSVPTDAPAGSHELFLEPARPLDGVAALWLMPGRYTIGSGSNCTLRLAVSGVGETHCEIMVDERRTLVKARDPRTWLNHGPVKESQLRPGDRLVVGPIEFAIRRGTQPMPARSPQGTAPQGARSDAIDQEILGTVQSLTTELQEREQALMQSSRVAREDLARVQNQTTIERAALREAEAAARARQTKLEVRARQLDVRATELADRAVRVEAKQRTLDEMLVSLEQQRSHVGSQRSDMDRNLSERQRRLAEAEHDLQRRRQILDEAEEKLGNRYACVHDEAEALLREKESLAAAMKAFEDAQQAGHAQSGESDALRATLAAEREQLRAERESLSQVRSEIEAERSPLENQRRALERLHQELEQQRRAVEAFEAGLSAREQQIQAGHEQLEADRERIQAERIELAAREDELEIRSRALERKRQGLESLGESQRAAADQARDERAEHEALRAIEDARRELQQEHEALREEQARLQAGREVLAAERSALEAERSAVEVERSAPLAQRYAEPAGFDIDTSLLDMERMETRERDLADAPSAPAKPEVGKDAKSVAVRSALADMFGVSRNMLEAQAAAVPEESETPPAVREKGPLAPASKPETHLDGTENPDSVAAYMEQLLARNRKPSSTPVEPYLPARSVEKPRQTSDARGDFDALRPMEQPSPEADEPAPAPAPRPRRPHDKNALRANLDTMREVANLSARKALESHARKRVKGMVVAKTLLAVAAFAVAAAIFGALLLGFRVSAIYGWAAVAIGGFVLADMFRATLMQWSQMFMRRWREKRAPANAASPRTGAVETASDEDVHAPAEPTDAE